MLILEMYYLSTKYQKVQLYVMLNLKQEIEGLLQEPVDVQPLLLDIETVGNMLELDYLQDKEKLSLVIAEP